MTNVSPGWHWPWLLDHNIAAGSRNGLYRRLGIAVGMCHHLHRWLRCCTAESRVTVASRQGRCVGTHRRSLYMVQNVRRVIVVDETFCQWPHHPMPRSVSRAVAASLGTHSCGVRLLRLVGTLPGTTPPITLPATLPLALATLYDAACCDCGVAGNQPLLLILSASIRRCSKSSVITSRCSYAASRESSFADAQ